MEVNYRIVFRLCWLMALVCILAFFAYGCGTFSKLPDSKKDYYVISEDDLLHYRKGLPVVADKIPDNCIDRRTFNGFVLVPLDTFEVLIR